MPQSLNSIFGRNLRTLCDERGSYAEFARLLDTNRVQLGRFFNGESFPKPNQLTRICKLFGVDARVFTTPLEELRAQKVPAESPYQRKILNRIKRYSQVPADLPDGLHMMYRENPVMPGDFSKNPFLVKRQNGLFWMRGLTPPPPGVSRRHSGAFSLRSWDGNVIGLTGGFCFQTYGAGNLDFFVSSFFTFKNRPTPNSFAGVFNVFLPQRGSAVSCHPIVIELLPQRAADVLSHFRSCGRISFSEIPPPFQKHLTAPVA